MNASNLKTFLTYATLGAGLASGVLLWNARQKMNLLSIPETSRPSISLDASAVMAASSVETKRTLVATVQGQLDAFRTNDYDKAFTFAVKGIQSRFTLKDFEQMVRRDYSVIAGWKSSRFGQSLDDGAKAVLQVFITGDDGGESEFEYNLEKEAESWKVAGVRGPVANPGRPAKSL